MHHAGPYEVIAARLRERIHDGRLALGDLVPTTHDLAVAHNVSIATAHRAIAVLAAEAADPAGAVTRLLCGDRWA